jgi:hypothetical protein
MLTSLALVYPYRKGIWAMFLLMSGGMESGIGVMLWIVDGKLSCLEAYTYGDEQLPETIDIISMTNFGSSDMP